MVNNTCTSGFDKHVKTESLLGLVKLENRQALCLMFICLNICRIEDLAYVCPKEDSCSENGGGTPPHAKSVVPLRGRPICL